jgi:hypothetical protein
MHALKKIGLLSVAGALFILCAPVHEANAAKAKQPAAKPAEAPAAAKEDPAKAAKKPEIRFTEKEMLDVIKMRLGAFPEITSIIPGFTVKKISNKDVEYYFQTGKGKEPVLIDSLDKQSLYELFLRVNNEATRLQTERLMRQLEQQQNLMRNIMQQQQQQQRQQQQMISQQQQQQTMNMIRQQQQNIQQQQNNRPAQPATPPRAYTPPSGPPPGAPRR